MEEIEALKHMDDAALIDWFLAQGCSCIVKQRGGRVCVGRERGVLNLYNLYTNAPQMLKEAWVVDKVVGKGAAALMALGGIARLHALVISEAAYALLMRAGVQVTFGQRVEHIINRSRTGMCPLESRCATAHTPGECFPLIEAFVEEMREKSNTN